VIFPGKLVLLKTSTLLLHLNGLSYKYILDDQLAIVLSASREVGLIVLVFDQPYFVDRSSVSPL
jgi:hypothetical protein